jgi:hypothetical protein
MRKVVGYRTEQIGGLYLSLSQRRWWAISLTLSEKVVGYISHSLREGGGLYLSLSQRRWWAISLTLSEKVVGYLSHSLRERLR